MNEYQKKEATGRKLFQDFANKVLHQVHNINFTKDDYDSTDVYYWSGYGQTVAEIKTRDYNHTQTWNNTEGWIFEKRKWDELKAIQMSAYTDTAYICIFRDAMVIWDLTQFKEPNWIEKECWENHECKRKVLKKVAYLKVSEASHVFKNQFQFKNKK
jgi:hypothetical protein